jgi:hypothetical protein
MEPEAGFLAQGFVQPVQAIAAEQGLRAADAADAVFDARPA